MERTKATFKNFIWSNVNTIVVNIFNFVLRTIFIRTLGATYLGVSSLFTNVLSMLSLAELGIGTAISFSLYKPLAKNDEKKIQAYINFYKKAYRIVALVVLVIGVALIPFLPQIAKGSDGVSNLTLIYCLYLFNSVSSYLITYKTTIISADQRGYKLTNINTIASLITMAVQAIELLVFKNFIGYLLVSVIIGLIKNIYANYHTGKLYPYLRHSNAERLSKDEKKVLLTKIKALLYHTIGEKIIFQTDNIITSTIINVTMVGYVTNYNMVINTIKTIVQSFCGAAIPSFGNLQATESKEKQLKTYKNVEFLGYWMNLFSAISLYFLIPPFITIWIGSDYILDNSVLIILIINFYILMTRTPMTSFRNASGIYEPDRFSPLIESAINLVVSIVLAKKIGIMGIYIGTLASSFVPFIWCPIVVHKYIFKTSSKPYFARQAFRFCTLIFCAAFMTLIVNQINISNIYLYFIVVAALCLLIPNAFVVLLHFKTDEFKYIISLLTSKLSALKRK